MEVKRYRPQMAEIGCTFPILAGPCDAGEILVRAFFWYCKGDQNEICEILLTKVCDVVMPIRPLKTPRGLLGTSESEGVCGQAWRENAQALKCQRLPTADRTLKGDIREPSKSLARMKKVVL